MSFRNLTNNGVWIADAGIFTFDFNFKCDAGGIVYHDLSFYSWGWKVANNGQKYFKDEAGNDYWVEQIIDSEDSYYLYDNNFSIEPSVEGTWCWGGTVPGYLVNTEYLGNDVIRYYIQVIEAVPPGIYYLKALRESRHIGPPT